MLAADVGCLRFGARLLDQLDIELALLTGGPGQLASAICRAFNGFWIGHWLANDSRFRLALHINSQDPARAAAEIDRLGSHPGVCAIMLGCGAPRPFGSRFYHPIYEACVRNGLAVAMHFGGEGAGLNPPPSAAGYPSYSTERRQPTGRARRSSHKSAPPGRTGRAECRLRACAGSAARRWR
ncbi:MAG: amidohydrolase family protein [Geminicoccaceae bacterium]